MDRRSFSRRLIGLFVGLPFFNYLNFLFDPTTISIANYHAAQQDFIRTYGHAGWLSFNPDGKYGLIDLLYIKTTKAGDIHYRFEFCSKFYDAVIVPGTDMKKFAELTGGTPYKDYIVKG